MERFVGIIAPRNILDLLLKAGLLVACFTAFDHVVGSATGTGSAEHLVKSLVVTFMIGAPFGIFVMSVMAVQRRLQGRLQRLSETDFLTGLRNRACFLEQAAAALNRDPASAILMLDVDHFKAVNDTYGHYTGDVTLQQIARHITAQARDTDIIGRIGGEEFAILLSGSDGNAVAQIANRICQPIQIRTPMGIGEDALTFDVTVSVGGVFALPGYRLIDLMCKADEALYGAKAAGRNRVVMRDVTEMAA